MDNTDLLIALINTLESVEIKGTGNMQKIIDCVSVIKQIIAAIKKGAAANADDQNGN